MSNSTPPDPPSKRLQRLLMKPFVQDTLAPMFNGRLPAFVNARRPLAASRDAVAKSVPDTVRVYDDQAFGLPQLTHELGHQADRRALVGPIINDRVKRQAGAGAETGYATTNEDEYFAEAFAHALLSGRKRFADSTAVDREHPGAIELIRWLQTQPPFKK